TTSLSLSLHDALPIFLAFGRARCGRRRDRAAVRLRLPGRGAARPDDRKVRGNKTKRSEFVALLWCWRYAPVRATIGADHQERITPSRHGDCGFRAHTHTLEGEQ